MDASARILAPPGMIIIWRLGVSGLVRIMKLLKLEKIRRCSVLFLDFHAISRLTRLSLQHVRYVLHQAASCYHLWFYTRNP